MARTARVTIQVPHEFLAAGFTLTIKLHQVEQNAATDAVSSSPAAAPQVSAITTSLSLRPNPRAQRLVHFNLFLNLNWTSHLRVKSSLTKGEYKAVPFVSAKSYKKWRASFQDCGVSATLSQEERKLHLATLWRKFRKDSLMWTSTKGRVEHWSEFKKRNSKYLRSKFLKPSAIWAQYQRTWMDLIGFSH